MQPMQQLSGSVVEWLARVSDLDSPENINDVTVPTKPVDLGQAFSSIRPPVMIASAIFSALIL